MKLLLDMNLSQDWLPMLAGRGWKACHWSSIGKHNAPDKELMAWARGNSHVVEALAAGENALMDGALLIISGNNARLRPLPLP